MRGPTRSCGICPARSAFEGRGTESSLTRRISNKATMRLPPLTELIPVEVVADVLLNDTNRSVGGRNLYIQNLTLDGQSYAAANASSTASAG